MSDDEFHSQNLPNYFAEYCKRCHLKVNISKTKIMIFGGNVHSNNEIFTLNGRVIEIVKEFKYLDILLITQNGRFVQNTKKLAVVDELLILIYQSIVNLNCLIKPLYPFNYMVVKSLDLKISTQ